VLPAATTVVSWTSNSNKNMALVVKGDERMVLAVR